MATKRKTAKRYQKTSVPGLSVRFSWKEFLGITKLKRMFTKKTGIPTTGAGVQRKIGRSIADWLKGLYERRTGQTINMNSRGQIVEKKTKKKTAKRTSK